MSAPIYLMVPSWVPSLQNQVQALAVAAGNKKAPAGGASIPSK